MAGCDHAMGLAKMSEKYLQVPIDKSLNIRCSDWEDDRLSETQILYATLDALVAIELFKFFGEKIALNNSYHMQKFIGDCQKNADTDFKGN